MVSSAIVAHSMCQPGRPAVPRGPGQDGSPGPLAAPEHRVQRLPLAGAVGVSPALGEEPQHRRLVVAGLLAEAGRLRDVVVDVAGAVVQDVGQALVEQVLDVGDDPRDRLDRADEVLGRQHAQRRHVLAEQRRLAHAEDDPVLVVAVGALEQRVVDVGDVLHVVDGVAGVPPHPVDQVEGQVGGRVPEVRGVVGRDAADVHPRRLVGAGGHDLAAGGVVDLEDGPGPGQGRQQRGGPGEHGTSLERGADGPAAGGGAMELDEYLPVLEKTNRRFADAAAEAVLARGWTAPVPGCPGWRLADLVWHLAEVQHFWAWVVRTRAADPSTYVEPVRGARTMSCSASSPRRARSWRRRCPAPTRPNGCGPGRRSRTSPSSCAGRSRRRWCTPWTWSRCSATSARSRPTSGWTGSTSGWRSWSPARCRTGRPAHAHPVVLHAVDADAERTLFPGTRPVPDRRADRHRRRPAAGGLAPGAARGAHRGRRPAAGRRDDRPGRRWSSDLAPRGSSIDSATRSSTASRLDGRAGQSPDGGRRPGHGRCAGADRRRSSLRLRAWPSRKQVRRGDASVEHSGASASSRRCSPPTTCRARRRRRAVDVEHASGSAEPSRTRVGDASTVPLVDGRRA